MAPSPLLSTLVVLLGLVALSAAAGPVSNSTASNDLLPFSISEGYRSLNMAYAAYCDEGAVENWDCRWCKLEHNASFYGKAEDVERKLFGFVAYDSKRDTIVVSFRGTKGVTLENWLVNVKAMHAVPFEGMDGVKIHSGFYDGFRALRGQITDVLGRAMAEHPGAKITLTGHSLGGALATVCAADLIHGEDTRVVLSSHMEAAGLSFDLPHIDIVTFGSPRVGNKAFSDLVDETVDGSIRMVNKDDIVPHVPTREMLGAEYHHLGTEVWLHPSSGEEEGLTSSVYTTCDGSGEDPNCSASASHLSVVNHMFYMGVYEAC